MSDKYSQWWYETQVMLNKRKEMKSNKRRKAAATIITVLLTQLEKLTKRGYTKKRFWVNPYQKSNPSCSPISFDFEVCKQT